MQMLGLQDIQTAANILRAGGLVSFPTETVYGLGGDATNDKSVAKIYEAKGRPSFNPLIAHVCCLDMARSIADLDGLSLDLANQFWPGPMTLVATLKSKKISKLVTAGLDTIALRIPANPLARDLISAAGAPIAAPSANPSGQISPTTADHVRASLGDRIDAILDGGPCSVGVESTILRVLGDSIFCLRPGGLALEDVEGKLGVQVQKKAVTDDTAPNAPGQLTSHYAPNSGVRLGAAEPNEDELLLGFGPDIDGTLNLSPNGDPVEAAANLFRMLHEIDALATSLGKSGIAVAPIPDTGLGLAINDRLKRAAAPR